MRFDWEFGLELLNNYQYTNKKGQNSIWGVTCGLPNRWPMSLFSLWRIKCFKAHECLGICLPHAGFSEAEGLPVARWGMTGGAPAAWGPTCALVLTEIRTGLCRAVAWPGQHHTRKCGQMLECWEWRQHGCSYSMGWDWLMGVGIMQIQQAKQTAGRRAGVWTLFVKTSWRSLKTG